jgi:hypothetical protein
MDPTSLSQAILDLENGQMPRLEDRDLAFALAQHSKPYVDQLFELKHGNSNGHADDVDLSNSGIGSLADEAELTADPESSVEAELAEDLEGAPATRSKRKKRARRRSAPTGPEPELQAVSPGERARWLFMDRFISLEQHESILGYNFDEDDVAKFQSELDSLVERLLLLPGTIEAAETNDIPALQKLFATSVLIFRNPFIGDADDNPIPCNVANIRELFPDYFYKRRKKPNWFEGKDFYSDPIGRPHWVLCETEYINCTLRKPESKLRNFAKDWGVDIEGARQKSVVEDIYDRVICGEALEENIFARNCNCLTANTYGARRNGPGRLVYTVQRGRKITIHGKAGIPHWSAKRRLWPGIHPTLSLT